MTYLAKIYTKPQSRKIIYEIDDLIKDNGGVCTIETGCREVLCTNLARGNSLVQLVNKHPSYIKITIESDSISKDFIDSLNNWVAPTTYIRKHNGDALRLNGNWIIFNNSAYMSLPLLSVIPFLALNWSTFNLENIIKDILYDPYDFFDEIADAYFTAYYLWMVRYKYINHYWFNGLYCDGPSSYVITRFYYDIDWHRDFYNKYKSSIDKAIKDAIYSELNEDYWYIIQKGA